jgi:hypothetical protein
MKRHGNLSGILNFFVVVDCPAFVVRGWLILAEQAQKL